MARKDVLKGLMTPSQTPVDPPAPPRAQRGAIGAVSKSIADLKARSVVELDPHLIRAGGVQDRLESDAEEDAALARSIAEYGQQVPILVRPHPELEGQYQVVYGRRRVLAMRDLGLPVKALIRDLDDQELLLAQGQENTARRDLSYIEKVNFARQMEAAGYSRKITCDALSVDKTQISRMLSIAERIPVEVIENIGAAPSVGRDRWTAVADQLELIGADGPYIIGMINLNTSSYATEDRFQALWDYVMAVKARHKRMDKELSTEEQRLYAEDGLPLGQVKFDRNYCTMKLRLSNTEGFEDWLMENLPTLFRDYQAKRPRPTEE